MTSGWFPFWEVAPTAWDSINNGKSPFRIQKGVIGIPRSFLRQRKSSGATLQRRHSLLTPPQAPYGPPDANQAAPYGPPRDMARADSQGLAEGDPGAGRQVGGGGVLRASGKS